MPLHNTTFTVTCDTAPPDTIEGPVTVNRAVDASLTVDRTVAGGLQSLQSTDTVAVNIEGSSDGINWTLIVGSVWSGGVISGTGKNGPFTITSVNMNASVDPSQYSQVRMRVTPSTTVVLSGTITINGQ